MKKLPIGIQDFVKIRENGFHYIDKTASLYTLVNGGSVYFLSRPRRFGKSLLCSTLGALWEGRRDLFEGLAIDSLDWNWNTHPVIRLDLNAKDTFSTEEELHSFLSEMLHRSAETFGITLEDSSSLAVLFLTLIRNLCKKTGRKVVVIVDDYDKPLLCSIDNAPLHEQFRGIMDGFYSVLKSSDQYLTFVFMTGITSVSPVSIFYGLNHLRDISSDSRYATICGFTQDEVETHFAEEITSIAAEQGLTDESYIHKLNGFYNGYRFSSNPQTVFTCYGILNHFDRRIFTLEWLQSGIPQPLIKCLEEQVVDPRRFEHLELHLDQFTWYRKGTLLDILPLLYHSGFLTIIGFEVEYNLYTVGYPNNEIRVLFNQLAADHGKRESA